MSRKLNTPRIWCFFVLLALLSLENAEAFWWHHQKSKCPLDCQNGGICQKAKVPPAMMAQQQQQKNETSSSAFPPSAYYCHCPPLHAGPLCEIKYKTCPGSGPRNTTLCGNGAPCARDVNNDGEVYYRCECDMDATDYSSMYARRACRQAGTVFCTPPNNPAKQEQIQQSLGKASGSYCRNGGVCKDIRKKGASYHAGCDCLEGWEGSHCETPGSTSLADKLHYYEKDEVSSADQAAVAAAEQKAQREYEAALHQSRRRRKRFVWMCAAVAITALSMVGYSVYDGVRDSHRRRRRRRHLAARIPTEIVSSKKQQKKKQKKKKQKKSRHAIIDPLEIEDAEDNERNAVQPYHD